MIKDFLNPEGHQNPISGSKVTAILLKRWIWPIGGVASGRVCVCSLRSRLVFDTVSRVKIFVEGRGGGGSVAVAVGLVTGDW